MTDEDQGAQEQQMSLEDVYAKYNIQPVETPPQQSETETPTASDKDQPDLTAQIDRLTKQLEQQQQAINETQQQAARDAEERDLDQAIEYVEKNVKLPKKEHRKLVKLALANKYQEDPKFAAAWDGRQKNPRAFSAVLEATIPELRDLFSIKDSDQIAQNQLALDNAIKGSGAEVSEPEDNEAKLLQMNEGDFDRAWIKMSQGGM